MLLDCDEVEGGGRKSVNLRLRVLSRGTQSDVEAESESVVADDIFKQ